MDTGSYTINVNNIKKEFYVEVNGTLSNKQVDQFVSDYNRKVNAISASDFILRLDAKELNLVSPELVPQLEACYELYKQSGFKKTIFEIPNNVIIKMQLNRIARKVGLENTEFVQI